MSVAFFNLFSCLFMLLGMSLVIAASMVQIELYAHTVHAIDWICTLLILSCYIPISIVDNRLISPATCLLYLGCLLTGVLLASIATDHSWNISAYLTDAFQRIYQDTQPLTVRLRYLDS